MQYVNTVYTGSDIRLTIRDSRVHRWFMVRRTKLVQHVDATLKLTFLEGIVNNLALKPTHFWYRNILRVQRWVMVCRRHDRKAQH